MLAGFDPVEAFNLILGRLDRLAVALEKMTKAVEKLADIQEQSLGRK